MLAWHIRTSHFGTIRFDDLNLLALRAFEGNLWAGETKAVMGLFTDERADEQQREALQAIFSGQAGGWPASFAAFIGEVRGVEFVPITFEVANDLAYWRAEVPGKAVGRAEALTGPTTPPGQRVRTLNPPGSEVGPGQVAAWGNRSRSGRRGSASSGRARVGRASTFRSTGPGPLQRCRTEVSVSGPGAKQIEHIPGESVTALVRHARLSLLVSLVVLTAGAWG
jgi:hypothetical protein